MACPPSWTPFLQFLTPLQIDFMMQERRLLLSDIRHKIREKPFLFVCFETEPCYAVLRLSMQIRLVLNSWRAFCLSRPALVTFRTCTAKSRGMKGSDSGLPTLPQIPEEMDRGTEGARRMRQRLWKPQYQGQGQQQKPRSKWSSLCKTRGKQHSQQVPGGPHKDQTQLRIHTPGIPAVSKTEARERGKLELKPLNGSLFQNTKGKEAGAAVRWENLVSVLSARGVGVTSDYIPLPCWHTALCPQICARRKVGWMGTPQREK